MTDLLDTALDLAATDLPVFPLTRDKRPAVATGFHAASTDPAEIARMFADPRATYIGVPAGPLSGFDAIDIDIARGGLEWLHANEHRLPQTRRHHSRSGGVHLLLRHSPGMRTRFDRIAPGVEVRGDGGYIVWWPAHGFHVEGTGWAPWPEWLLIEALKGRRDPNAAPIAPADLAPPSADTLLVLLRGLPNPADITRGEYVSLNLAVAGCIRALVALDRCDEAEADDIREASAEWSARWEGATPSDYEAERVRWESDWDTRTNDISGWAQVLTIADRCGADTGPLRAAAAAAEFGAVPAAVGAADLAEFFAGSSGQAATPSIDSVIGRPIRIYTDNLTQQVNAAEAALIAAKAGFISRAAPCAGSGKPGNAPETAAATS